MERSGEDDRSIYTLSEETLGDCPLQLIRTYEPIPTLESPVAVPPDHLLVYLCCGCGEEHSVVLAVPYDILVYELIQDPRIPERDWKENTRDINAYTRAELKIAIRNWVNKGSALYTTDVTGAALKEFVER